LAETPTYEKRFCLQNHNAYVQTFIRIGKNFCIDLIDIKSQILLNYKMDLRVERTWLQFT